MAVNINIPSQVTQNITEGVTSTAPSEDAVFNALAEKANSADLAEVATSGDYNDLINQPTIPAAQVNSDWNATSGVAEILNKPTIPDVSGFVPYTGANADLDMGSYNVTADHITLNVSPSGPGFGVGSTQWNNTIGSSETLLKGGSVSLKNGVDLVARIVNKVVPNTTLTKAAYQAVKVSGATGGRLSVGLAQADVDLNSADTIGLVTETIATNQEGFILTVGQIENINTTGSLQGETWADGDVLYLSPTTAGKLTNIKPTGATGHIVVIGYVEYAHANNGKIYVKIMNGWELDELHNVYINPATLADNNLLQYDSATSLWKNESMATAGIQPTLTSGTSIKTINSTSLLGSGDVAVQPTLVSGTNIKTINGTSLLGSGDITVGGGITVGTTAVTSGTDTRVFFQQGGVVQQDAGFLFNSTNKTLTNYGKGAVTSNTSFGIGVFQNGTGAGTQNTAIGYYAGNYLTTGTSNTMVGYRAGGGILASNFTGNNNTLIGADSGLYLSSGIQNTFIGSSTGVSVTTGSRNTIIGQYTASLSASLAQNVIISDGASQVALWMNGSQRVGFGFNPVSDSLGAKVDIKAQGALSTDIAFRVRNSADSANILEVRGNTTFDFPTYLGGYQGGVGSEVRMGNAGTFYTQFNLFTVTGSTVATATNGSFIQDTSGQNVLFNSRTVGTSQISLNMGRANIHLGGLTADTHTGHNILGIANGTAPSASFTDRFMMYSADIVAGNAAPHFRTENGNIIKLYRQSSAGITTVADLVTVLTNLGLLA